MVRLTHIPPPAATTPGGRVVFPSHTVSLHGCGQVGKRIEKEVRIILIKFGLSLVLTCLIHQIQADIQIYWATDIQTSAADLHRCVVLAFARGEIAAQ